MYVNTGNSYISKCNGYKSQSLSVMNESESISISNITPIFNSLERAFLVFTIQVLTQITTFRDEHNQ